MIVKVPKEIQVGGHTYKIIYKPYLSKEDGFRGRLIHRRQEIWIEPDNPLSQRNVTLIHEILHLTETVFAIDFTEEVIERMAEGLYQALSDSFGIQFDWEDIESKEEQL